MVHNKFENQIKEKLEAREIQPSAKSWDRLDAMLSVAEEKKTKRFPFFSFQSIGIAASVLVLVSLGLYFLNQKETIPNKTNEVVAKEEIKSNNNDNKNINDNDKINNEVIIQPKEQVVETTNKKQQIINSNKSSKSFNSINQKTTINPIIIQEELVQVSAPEISVQKENSKFETAIKKLDSKNIKVNASDLLASVESETKSTNEAKKLKIKVDSNSLLSQVDGELEQTFREKVISKISKNYKEVKVVLSNRNQQK